MVTMKKRYFFGWNNIKWFITEIGKLYSVEKSYFSKKRVESGIAFAIGQWGMMYFLFENINSLSSSDIALWAGIEFAIAGYMVREIQQEKKINKDKYDEFFDDNEI
jgi:hypothetical protein